MLSLFIVGLFLFLSAIFVFKLILFVLGVLLAGAGFLIKFVILLIILFPIFPIIIFLAGNFFSFISIFLIITCGIILSYIFVDDRRYSR
ncbi:MAG: hypothetical protein OCD02_22460 [Spirochaetaceae bacterium]